MTYGLANLVLENCNNPGTGTINLGGAEPGRLAFVQGFASGAKAFYFLTDGTQSEWGIGTVTAGSPNTLSRDTILGNSAGTTSALSFTGSCQVYCDVPAEKSVVADASGNVMTSGSYQTSGTISGAAFISTSTAGGSSLVHSTGNGLVITQAGSTGTSNIALTQNNTSGAFMALYYGTSTVGSLTTNGSGVSLNSVSDYRLKVLYGLADVEELIMSIPIYLAEMMHGDPRPMALAHDLQRGIPNSVIGEKDAVDDKGRPIPQRVDLTMYIPPIMAFCQMMLLRVRALETAQGIKAPAPPPCDTPPDRPDVPPDEWLALAKEWSIPVAATAGALPSSFQTQSDSRLMQVQPPPAASAAPAADGSAPSASQTPN